MPALQQIALARQADILVGPGGNELGLVAFARFGAWVVELVPPPIALQNASYELAYCAHEGWDNNPGSIVGHPARRAGAHHACLLVAPSIGRRLIASDVSSPHWRETPGLVVSVQSLKTTLQSALTALAFDHGIG
mmetsp:Transcript_43991/g.141022  ORF Transcript_43991/g.141022 Transcript_43991/m.141022 type:complete len:135 (+) Transcript_43991:146-550(+)